MGGEILDCLEDGLVERSSDDIIENVASFLDSSSGVETKQPFKGSSSDDSCLMPKNGLAKNGDDYSNQVEDIELEEKSNDGKVPKIGNDVKVEIEAKKSKNKVEKDVKADREDLEKGVKPDNVVLEKEVKPNNVDIEKDVKADKDNTDVTSEADLSR